MHCESCVSKVQQALKSIEGVNGVSVSLSGQTANVAGEGEVETMLEAVSKVGYKASVINKVEAPNLNTNEELPVSDLQKLFPLFLIFAYIIIASALLNKNPWDINGFMLDFMGLFYVLILLLNGLKQRACIARLRKQACTYIGVLTLKHRSLLWGDN